MSDVEFETGWRYDRENETWRPPAYGVAGPHEHLVRDLRPGTLPSGVLVPAANVQAGTFGAGNFTFPGILTVAGGALELRSISGNAFIDFTRAPGTDDFNVRLENDANNRLHLWNGTFFADTVTGGEPIQVGGAGSGYRMYDRDDGSQYFVLYSTIDKARIWSSLTGADVFSASSVGLGNVGSAGLGTSSPHGASWASFHNTNQSGSAGGYALLASTGGETLLNGASGTAISFRINNSNKAGIDASNFGVQVPINLNSQTFWTKAYGDNAHRIQHSGGLDSLEYWTWASHRFISTNALRTVIDGDINNFGGLYKGTWGGNAPGLKSRSGGNVCQLQWWSTFEMWVDATLVKTFVIDHPTNKDKYLVHATVEGPEAVVVYRGQAALESGWVEVKLPDYFEALTKIEGRSVHLTSIADNPEDEWCPVLHATYPKNGKFYVGLGSGLVVEDQRFWWEVKAVRKDVSINVEPNKKDVVVMGTGPYTYYKEKQP